MEAIYTIITLLIFVPFIVYFSVILPLKCLKFGYRVMKAVLNEKIW